MISEELFRLRDEKYRDFNSKLIPNVPLEDQIGVRLPDIRALAKKLSPDEIEAFIKELPHKYHEENHLHGILLGRIKDYERCICETERFLPYITNWAVCDTTAPKCFSKHKSELLPHIKAWLGSEHTYTIRFGIGMLMRLFLDEDFKTEYLEMAAEIRSDEYYVKMMIAWYFATALAKQWDSAVKYIENRRLDVWTHNKAIQKSCESFRVSPEHKEYLKSLRISLILISD